MKKDIRDRADVELLVNAFYDKVNQDDLLSPIFNEVAHVNWNKHLPVMYQFWENIIFYSGNYTGNPLDVHQRLHQLHPLQEGHFQRWNQLFIETVDALFQGNHAEMAKKRALSISAIMQNKIGI